MRKNAFPPSRHNGFQTLKSRVYETLRQEILSGAIPPGARLVRRLLSQRLGVSPIPVIEALHQLEKDGLVESEPMFGHRVRALSVEAARNDHVLREALECQAARLCAKEATDQQLEALADQAEQLDQILKSDPEGASHSEEHLEFHLAVVRSTGYRGLVEALEKLWFRRLMVFNTVNATALGLPRNWHGQLVNALASREPDQAAKAMREHVRYNVERQLELLQQSHLLTGDGKENSPKPAGRPRAAARDCSALTAG